MCSILTIFIFIENSNKQNKIKSIPKFKTFEAKSNFKNSLYNFQSVLKLKKIDYNQSQQGLLCWNLVFSSQQLTLQLNAYYYLGI